MLLMGTWYFAYKVAPLSAEFNVWKSVFLLLLMEVHVLRRLCQELLSITDFDLWGCLKPMTRLGWCQWVGAAIFAWGWLHQYCCHAILGSLREHRDRTVEYVIPYGDWFDIVSSPHYLAEMVILFHSLL
ncbi:hypothetical protein REPUB_Repub09cG0194100 [Reevesia pubescens]